MQYKNFLQGEKKSTKEHEIYKEKDNHASTK